MTSTLQTRCVVQHSTPSRMLNIEKMSALMPVANIHTNKDRFSDLCKSGCVNFGKKYSCPPFSPSFENFSKSSQSIQVLYYRVFLDQYADSTPYNRVRASNSVIKSLLDRELLSFKSKGFKVVGSGSCRACKPCGAKIRVKCKKPDKLIYSLEALGVDVGALVKKCFDIDLQWYKKGRSQDYTSVVGGYLS